MNGLFFSEWTVLGSSLVAVSISVMSQRSSVRSRLAALGAMLLFLLAGCSASTSQSTPASPTSSAAKAIGSLVVLAPGTLANAVPAINSSFQSANPDAKVTPNLGHSPAQVIALGQGTPGDVFITIGSTSMDQAKQQKLLADDPVDFASNRFQIVVPKGNPKHVSSLADLEKLDVVLADNSTPGGMLTTQMLAKDGVTIKPVSLEQGPPAVVQKVATGNADAGIAFVTDVLASDKVEGVDIPDAQQVPVSYQAAVLAKAQNPQAAEAYVSFLTGSNAQQVLQNMGFLKP